MTEPAAGDEATPAEPVDGAKCPFAPVNRLADVSKLLRSKTAVTHSPDLFAGRESDEVNGEINVREFLGASMMFLEGESHRRRRKLLNPLVRADALDCIREDIVLPEADRLMALRLAEPDANGKRGMDLVEFLERVFIHFTARLIGRCEPSPSMSRSSSNPRWPGIANSAPGSRRASSPRTTYPTACSRWWPPASRRSGRTNPTPSSSRRCCSRPR
jgi:cytochrome P450